MYFQCVSVPKQAGFEKPIAMPRAHAAESQVLQQQDEDVEEMEEETVEQEGEGYGE